MANAKPKSWRDWLQVHPAADLFPLMPPDELRALADDIKAHGLKHPAAFFIRKSDDMPVLFDGRNRLDALELNGEDITLQNFAMFDQVPEDIDAVAYVISVNIRRKHLSAEDKRELIAKLLKADPTKSNRQVAKIVDASHPHIAKVREELEKAGDVETVTTSVDTKGRQQPAHKAPSTARDRQIRAVEKKARETAKEIADRAKTPPPPPARALPPPSAAGEVERLTARVEELQNEKRLLELKITGLESEVEELKAQLAAAPAPPSAPTGDDDAPPPLDAREDIPGIPNFRRRPRPAPAADGGAP